MQHVLFEPFQVFLVLPYLAADIGMEPDQVVNGGVGGVSFELRCHGQILKVSDSIGLALLVHGCNAPTLQLHHVFGEVAGIDADR